jgi:hypothetical protein
MTLVPDIFARIHLFATEQGGRTQPIPAAQFGCPLFFADEGFDCRLLLDQTGSPLLLGTTMVVPIKFLNPQSVMPRLKVGEHFLLWEGKYIAEGEVTEILNAGIS